MKSEIFGKRLKSYRFELLYFLSGKTFVKLFNALQQSKFARQKRRYQINLQVVDTQEDRRRRGFPEFKFLDLTFSQIKSLILNIARVFNFTGFCLLICFLAFTISVNAQLGKFEDRQINEEDITITFEGKENDPTASEQYLSIVRSALGERYSAVKVRDALQELYLTNKIAAAQVETTAIGENRVKVRFIIRRKTEARRVSVVINDPNNESPFSEDELLYRLSIIQPGEVFIEADLNKNIDSILDYLRERGFYNAEAEYSTTPVSPDSDTKVAVTFIITPKAQTTVKQFDIDIVGFDATKVKQKLKLKPGEPFTRELLAADVERIRQALRDEKYLAPELREPRVVYDRNDNSISVSLNGKVGAIVNVSVDADKKVGESKQRELLPVKRDGTLDYSAIIEGEKRLETYYQEQGYFFADVTPYCAVRPDFTESEASYTQNDTEVLCSALNGGDLTDRVVDVTYRADLNRQYKLIDIRLEGTDQFTIDEISAVLETQEASILGIIPYLGYGRGYTSVKLLENDRRTIQTLLYELGYRRAAVRVLQGVAPNGEDLIITFVVDQGIPTVVDEVEIVGNNAFDDTALNAELPQLIGRNLSRARIRNGQKALVETYANAGYYDAKLNYSVIELPEKSGETEDRVKIVYTIETEGTKVYVNRILVSGNDNTKRESIVKRLNVETGEPLRAVDVFSSEQNLYQTDVFRRVTVKPEPAGERDDGNRLRDILVNVEEQPARVITYGGGFSTDDGAFGNVDIRHYNLFGRLQQGGARIRVSQRQQLVQLDFSDPRFMNDGKTDKGYIRYAPLKLTALFQRDSTVTRFFRSAFDQGTFGIVQRVDEDGNPIDFFGTKTGDPTIQRISFTAETSRTISEKRRSLLFANYKFEQVNLLNIDSLLIRDILQPDSNIRTSGFGLNFVMDTRENCLGKTSILEIIQKGEPGDPCKYSAGDPSRGDFLTAEYSVSVPFLGSNIGFHKFQASYSKFFTFTKLKNTTLAGRAVLGLGSVFSKRQRFSSSQFPDLEGILPVSERFFAGGSTTLRGFAFDTAGPRVVIVPQGQFLNSNREPVFLDPFTVPFGGNGLVIINLEARVPLTDNIRFVPFYDGGNVFRRVGDIFNPPDVPPTDVFRQNLRALFTHTVGIGLRLKTPIGGEFAVDYGYLLNPQKFLVPQRGAPNAIFQPRREQLHFRFSQAF